MKLLLCLTILTVSLNAFAKSEVKDFNQALIRNVQKEVQQDDERFRKQSPSRGPASIQEQEPVFYEDPKIEKGVRQTGHSKW